ncbi:MAG: hypothetical protein ACFCVK_22855, partial [Acidimicrobiales bacterium]
MSRTPTAQQAAISFAAILLVVGLAAALLRPGDTGEGLEAASAADSAPADVASTGGATQPVGLAGDTGGQRLPLPPAPSPDAAANSAGPAPATAPAIATPPATEAHDHAAPAPAPAPA